MNDGMQSYSSMTEPSRKAQVPERINRLGNAVGGHIELLKKLEGRLAVALRPPGSYIAQVDPQPLKSPEEVVGLAKELDDILALLEESNNVVNSMLQRLEL